MERSRDCGSKYGKIPTVRYGNRDKIDYFCAVYTIEFMAEDENLLKWQETSGNAIVVEGIDYELDPVLDKYKDYVVDGAFYYTQVEWKNSAGIFKEMIAAVQDVIAGADTIENVPKRLDEKNKELDE